MMSRLRIAGCGALALALVAGGLALKERLARVHVAASVQQAGNADQSATRHEAKSEAYAEEAEKIPLEEDATETTRRRAEVVRLTTHPVTAPQASPTPAPVQVDPTVLDEAKNRLIEALTRENADLKAALGLANLSRKESGLAIEDLKAENQQLRVALAAHPPERNWAVGISYGTNNTAGCSVERDFGPLRVGLDVVRRQVNGGQTTLEAVGHVAWRF